MERGGEGQKGVSPLWDILWVHSYGGKINFLVLIDGRYL